AQEIQPQEEPEAEQSDAGEEPQAGLNPRALLSVYTGHRMLEQEVSSNDEDLAEQAEEKREGGHRRSSATADGAAARKTPTKTNRIPSARPELICSCRKTQAEIGTINSTMLCTAKAIPTGIVLSA